MDKITEVSHQQSLQTKCKMLVAITIYALLAFMSQKRFTHFWHLCCGNDLRTSSGKFLRVKVCRPESCDFLGLCGGPMDQLDLWTNGPMGQWTNGPMDKWTNGPMDQWTNGSMDQWTNGPMDQGTYGTMDKKILRPYEKKNTLEHRNNGTLEHLNIRHSIRIN